MSGELKIKLSYQQWGEGTEPVLLLHGLADNKFVWSSLAEYLAPNYELPLVAYG